MWLVLIFIKSDDYCTDKVLSYRNVCISCTISVTEHEPPPRVTVKKQCHWISCMVRKIPVTIYKEPKVGMVGGPDKWPNYRRPDNNVVYSANYEFVKSKSSSSYGWVIRRKTL